MAATVKYLLRHVCYDCNSTIAERKLSEVEYSIRAENGYDLIDEVDQKVAITKKYCPKCSPTGAVL